MIAATLRCVARYGLSKTTVDDIAREAGLSRATLYRAFPGGREELLAATLSSEIDRFLDALADRLESAEDLEALLVTVLSFSADALARHDALAFLLGHEPEVVLGVISFDGFDHLLALAADFLAPYLAPSLGEAEARRVAEWMTRLVVSYLGCPAGAVAEPFLGFLSPAPPAAEGEARFALHAEPIGEERARRLVRQFVLPGVHVLTAAERTEKTSQ